MAYARTTTVDTGPAGDTIVQGVIDLDTDLTAIYTDLNTHEALTETHGATGEVVGTTNTQTLTQKTLTSPTLTGTVTLSSATLTGGTYTSPTINTPTVVTPTVSGGTFTSPTITGTGTIAGVFTGNLTGNVTGNITGNITGSAGSCTGNAATATTATNLSGGTVSGTTGVFSGKVQVVNPYFFAYITSTLNNVTGDNTVYPLTGAIWTEVTDVGTCFSNGTFTAPYTGKYLFSGTLSLSHANCDTFTALLVTSDRNHSLSPNSNTLYTTTWGLLDIPFFKIADMEAGDTAYLSLQTNLASPVKYTDILGGGVTQFYGYLLP